MREFFQLIFQLAIFSTHYINLHAFKVNGSATTATTVPSEPISERCLSSF